MAWGYTMITPIDSLAEAVHEQANALFPNRTDQSMYLKMYEEMAEVISSDGDPLEVADVFIMILDYAKRKGIDIESAVREKMAINWNRGWKQTASGTFKHTGD